MTNTNKKSKNTRKLLGAIGMLSVSAAMLVSSTFAWFSMNKKVSAQTMSIQAKSADPNLLISADNGTTWANNLTTGENWTIVSPAEKLKLVTPTAIGSTMAWGWAASTNPNEAQGTNTLDAITMSAPSFDGNNRSAYLEGTVNDLTDKFVLYQELQIKNVSPDIVGENLKITDVTIDTGNNTIGQSVRLMFVVGNNYEMYKAPASGTTAVTTAPTMLTGSATKFTNQVIDDEIQANSTEIVTVKVYMYFDGTDASAYTNNASDLSDVSASFAFEIDPENQTPAGP